MDTIVTFWFFVKCGFGAPAIIQLVDDVLELVGIPGRTICVIAGILIANNPKLAKLAEVAATIETGGASKELEGAEEALKAGRAAEGITAAQGEASVMQSREGITQAVAPEAPKGNLSGTEAGDVRSEEISGSAPGGEAGGGNEEESKEDQRKKADEEAEKKMRSGAEITSEENLENEIFDPEMGKRKDDKREDDEGADEEEDKQKSKVVSGDKFQEYAKKSEETKREQKQQPKMIDLNEPRRDDQAAA
jgi:hypothetical protein